MKIYRVINTSTNTIINRVLLNRPEDWTPPAGCALAEDSAAPDPPRPLTPLQFKRRFTSEERRAILASTDAYVREFLDLLACAQDVRLDDPDTALGVNYLELTGLIGQGRATEILTP